MVGGEGAGAPGDVTEVLGLVPVSEEGLMAPENKKKYEEIYNNQGSSYLSHQLPILMVILPQMCRL